MLTKRESRTLGIDIDTLSLEVPHEDDNNHEKKKKKRTTTTLDVSVWDFAGQRIYQDVHVLFMSSNALYVIVFNLSDFDFHGDCGRDLSSGSKRLVAAATTSENIFSSSSSCVAPRHTALLSGGSTLSKMELQFNEKNRILDRFSAKSRTWGMYSTRRHAWRCGQKPSDSL